MYEVEVKVEAAHAPVRERLADLGAEPLGVVHQHDTYYDHPDRSFAESDEALRLREETIGDGADEPETTARLTYKGPLLDDVSKTREEVETGVSDHESTDALLRSVGFEPAAVVEKERERFVLGDFVVALDSVADLGEFVEVEAHASAEPGGDDDVATLRDGAFDLCRRLDLNPDESTRTSYLGLLLEADG